jgi:hypothetical protein
LVGQGSANPFFDSNRAVGGELRALIGVETLDGFHQAEVAFVDEVEQRQAEVLVFAGDLDDEAEIRANHVLASLFVTILNASG